MYESCVTPRCKPSLLISCLLPNVFLGYIVAYVSHNKTDATVVCPTSSAVTGEKTTGTEDVLPPPSQDVVLPSLNWDDIVRLLEQKLDKDALKNKIRYSLWH